MDSLEQYLFDRTHTCILDDGGTPNRVCVACAIEDTKRQASGQAGPVQMRKFESGATRDSDTTKLDFEGFDSPLVNKRYAQYMDLHRKQADGTMRGSDNWQLGIDKEAYVKSLIRHMEDVKLHWDGFSDEAVDADFESVLCAVLFNVKGLLYETLRAKRGAASSHALLEGQSSKS